MSLEEIKSRLNSISTELIELKNRESELKRLEFSELQKYSKLIYKDIIDLDLFYGIYFHIDEITDSYFTLKTNFSEMEGFYHYVNDNLLGLLFNFDLDDNLCHIDVYQNHLFIRVKFDSAKEFIKKYNIWIYRFDFDKKLNKLKENINLYEKVLEVI